MNITEIPAAFQSKLRLAIIASLIDGSKNFSVLQKITCATPGNLGKQLEMLEQENYINSKKQFINKRPNTVYILNDVGKKAFLSYVELLNSIVEKSGITVV